MVRMSAIFDKKVRGQERRLYEENKLIIVNDWLNEAAGGVCMTDAALLYSILEITKPSPVRSMDASIFRWRIAAHLVDALRCKFTGAEFEIKLDSQFYRPFGDKEAMSERFHDIRSRVAQAMEVYDEAGITKRNSEGKLDLIVPDSAWYELQQLYTLDEEMYVDGAVANPSPKLFAVAAAWFPLVINEWWLSCFLSDWALFVTTVYVLTAPFAGMYSNGAHKLQERLCIIYELSKGSRVGLARLLRNLTTTNYFRLTSDAHMRRYLLQFEKLLFNWSLGEKELLRKWKAKGWSNTRAEIELAKEYDYRVQCDLVASWIMDPTAPSEPPTRLSSVNALFNKECDFRQDDFFAWIKMDRKKFDILCRREVVSTDYPCRPPIQLMLLAGVLPFQMVNLCDLALIKMHRHLFE